MADSASFGLQWLDEVLRIRKSVCLVNRFGEQRSCVLATHGLSPRDVRALDAALADWADSAEANPWDRGPSPQFLPRSRSTGRPVSTVPPRLTELYQAVPLGAPGARDEQRLLLVQRSGGFGGGDRLVRGHARSKAGTVPRAGRPGC